MDSHVPFWMTKRDHAIMGRRSCEYQSDHAQDRNDVMLCLEMRLSRID
jgi:hypothetical protein